MGSDVGVKSARYRVVKGLGTTVGMLLVLGALATYYLWLYYHTPAAREAEERVVTIAPGTSLERIANILTEAGLLRHRVMFVLYVQWLRAGPHLQAGEYVLRATMSPAQIADMLRRGQVRHHVLTIPEGSTVRDIAKRVAAKDFGAAQVIHSLAHDTDFIASLGLTAPSLEGYLFPDTYHIPRRLGERALLTLMVRTMQANYTAEIAQRAASLGLSQHDVLTLASLIEKETGRDDERERISAVFHNRLRRGMRLQCDPTVIYALGDRFDGNLRKRDLRIDSPYNTYRYAGLPPSPIANAGRRALEAAVAPEAVDYLYFVATGQEGRHTFSTTLQAHNKAVRTYQLKPANR